MKVFSVLTLLLLAFVCAKCQELTKDGAIAVANACKTEAGATDADVEGMLKRQPAASKEAKCMRACFMKKFGALNADGKLDKGVALLLVKAIAKDDAQKAQLGSEVLDICADIPVDNDHCEAAEQYSVCLKKESDAKGVNLSF